MKLPSLNIIISYLYTISSMVLIFYSWIVICLLSLNLNNMYLSNTLFYSGLIFFISFIIKVFQEVKKNG